MSVKTAFGIAVAAFVAHGAMSGSAFAQTAARGVFGYLQKEPMTLFDAGMKSLRRQALDTAAHMSAKPYLDATARVQYKATEQQIEIVIDIENAQFGANDNLRTTCIDLRNQSITKMFRLGVAANTMDATRNERIRSRLGAQFAHEPSGSMHEFQVLGDRLAPITYFSVHLSVPSLAGMDVTCRAQVTDMMRTVP